MAIQIIVDSAADFEKQELDSKNIICVPLTINVGDKSYKDGIELTKEEFYHKLIDEGEYPKTSQPSPEDYLTHYKKAKENGDEVVVITLSAGLSGTYQSANIAKQLADYENIYIVNSDTAVAAIRILVEQALSMREAGKGAAEIAQQLEAMKHRVKLYAAIDTLEYLYKGGRVTKAQAGVGELAKIKPLITLNEEGKVDIWGKCIGGKKAMNQLCKKMGDICPDPEYPLVFVYTHNRENCEKFKYMLVEKEYDVTTAPIYNIGSTIGAHTGSGAFGFVYVEKAK